MVTLKASADFETKTSYSFNVIANDGDVTHNTTQGVVVSVNNLDEVAPSITSGNIATAINENSGANQVVYTATSTDTIDYVSGSTSYSLKTGSDASLSINATSGAVTLTTNPDYEAKTSYSFTVVATDAANNASEKAVTLAINNLNDNAPSFTSGNTGSVLENAVTSTVVYAARATDADNLAALTYTLGGTDTALLNINSTTGDVTLTTSADYESGKTSYSFNVIANDGTNNTTQAVLVSVNNVNDHLPTSVSIAATGGTIFANTINSTNTNLTASATIWAGDATGGSAVLKVGTIVVATDSEILAGDTSVSFTTPGSTPAELQALVNAGGVVTVELTDTTGHTTVSSGGPMLLRDILPPSFTTPSSGLVKDMGTGVTATDIVYQAAATDSSGSVSYAKGSSGADDALFDVSSTGAVTFRGPTSYVVSTDAGANLYDVSVVATDAVGNTSTQIVTLTVARNSIPVFSSSTVQNATTTLGYLIAPVMVDGGNIFYFWDSNGSTTADINDKQTHDALNLLFKYDGNLVAAGAGVVATNANYHYTTLFTTGGDALLTSLPTYSGAAVQMTGTGVGTLTPNESTGSNAVNSYDDLPAIWDAYNGTGTTNAAIAGAPPSWVKSSYWSANPSAAGNYYTVSLANGNVSSTVSNSSFLVAVGIQNLGVDITLPTLDITSTDHNLVGGDVPATITFAFSEVVKSFDSADITGYQSYGSLGSLSTSDSGQTYTATFTPNANQEGVLFNFAVAAGSYNDTHGNLGAAGVMVGGAISIDNKAPVFSSPVTAAMSPDYALLGVATSTTVYQATATDASGSIAFGLTPGVVDNALFNIDAGTGVVTFKNFEDYSNPTGIAGKPLGNTDHVYDISVTATDANGNLRTQTVAVSMIPSSIAIYSSASTQDQSTWLGNLIAPVVVDAGHIYYYWDSNGNTVVDALDKQQHNPLDSLFKYDSTLLNTNAAYATTGTTDIYRFANLYTNGGEALLSSVPLLGNLALNTATTNASAYDTGTAVGTAAPNASAGSNVSISGFNDLSAIWDAYNGIGTPSAAIAGAPPTWAADVYWTGSSNPTGPVWNHYTLNLSNGYLTGAQAVATNYVALEVSAASLQNLSLLTIDNTPPTLDITSLPTQLGFGQTAVLAFTFSEPPNQSFTASDVVCTYGSLVAGSFTATANPRVYTATFQPQTGVASGTATVTVAGTSYCDAAGNAGNTKSKSFNIDTVAPAGVSNLVYENTATEGSYVYHFINIAEAAAGYTITGMRDSTATVSVSTGDVVTNNTDGSWSVTLSPTTISNWLTDGAKTVTFVSTDGFNNTTNTNVILTVDRLRPYVISVDIYPNGNYDISSVSTSSPRAQFNWYEHVYNFSTADVTISAGSISAVTNLDYSYAFNYAYFTIPNYAGPFASITMSGTVNDLAGNDSTATFTKNIRIDTLGPTLTWTTSASIPAGGKTIGPTGSVFIPFTASEPIYIGVSAGTLDNPAKGTQSISGNSTYYQLVFTPAASLPNGTTVTYTLLHNNYLDYLYNPGLNDLSYTFTIDSIPPPAPTISSYTGGDNVINNAEKNLAFTFTGTSSEVATFNALIDNVNGFSTQTFNASTGDWTASIPGSYISTFSEGAHFLRLYVTDAVGNVGNYYYTFYKDTVAPTSLFMSAAADLVASTTPRITFNFDDVPGSTFGAGSVTINDGITGSTGYLDSFSGSGASRTAVYHPDAAYAGGPVTFTVSAFTDDAGNPYVGAPIVQTLLHPTTSAFSPTASALALASLDSTGTTAGIPITATVYDANATDASQGGLVDAGITYTLSAGSGTFGIDAKTGAVHFINPAVFDTVTPANNTYNFTVHAVDSVVGHAPVDQAVALTLVTPAATPSIHVWADADHQVDMGFLIAPVTVDNGSTFYYWDRNSSGGGAGTAAATTANDGISHTTLNGIFKYDSTGAPNLDLGTTGTSSTFRYGTLYTTSGTLQVALPTQGDSALPGYSTSGTTRTPSAVGDATTASLGSTADNGTYNDLLAVWDAYNGQSITDTSISGTPTSWSSGRYWAADMFPSYNGHSTVTLAADANRVWALADATPYYVALQVL